MCVVSMIGDHYRDLWQPQPWYPNVPNYPYPYSPPTPTQPFTVVMPAISREEFDELKRQVTEMKELLRRAKLYDVYNGQPDCEMDEKMDLLRRIAKMVGISLDDALKQPSR